MKKVMKQFCGFIILGIFLTLFLNGCTDQATTKELQESDIPSNIVFRPTFEIIEGDLIAGTAFAVKFGEEGSTIILTALHIFGPAGGLEADIPASELPSYVAKVTLNDLFEKSYVGVANEVLVIPKSKPYPESIDKDVAAFTNISSENILTLELYGEKLSVGEPVWLLASVMGGESSDKKLNKGKVIKSESKQLVFQYDNSDIGLTATSGAPILNSNLQVVGINIACGSKNGKLYGFANPSISVIKLLKEALRN
ncbi:MAG: hypothetical protein KAX49_09905 [Halanaerobiales bacterium]|nr:hypothetical protein [Halanaerobiales bacterium]